MTIYYEVEDELYVFDGWRSSIAPKEAFRDCNWSKCLHGVIIALHILQDDELNRQALSDRGVIHELTHLICEIPDEFRDMASLFKQVNRLEVLARRRYNEINESSFDSSRIVDLREWSCK